MKPQVILHSLGYLTHAAAMTVAVSLAGIVLGFVIGALVCVARVSRRAWLKRLAASMSASSAACRCSCSCCSSIIFSPNSGSTCRRSWRRSAGSRCRRRAYQAEILRGALNAVPRGQAEAATALGFSGLDIWRRILLPQALRISSRR